LSTTPSDIVVIDGSAVVVDVAGTVAVGVAAGATVATGGLGGAGATTAGTGTEATRSGLADVADTTGAETGGALIAGVLAIVGATIGTATSGVAVPLAAPAAGFSSFIFCGKTGLIWISSV
jgi:hypothetical protein